MLWSYKQEKQRFMKKSSFLEFLKASFKMCVCDVNVLRSFHRFKSRYVKKILKKHMKMPMELITLFPTYSIAGHFRGSNIFAGLTKLLNGSVLNFTIWQYWYLCCTHFFSCPMLFFFVNATRSREIAKMSLENYRLYGIIVAQSGRCSFLGIPIALLYVIESMK